MQLARPCGTSRDMMWTSSANCFSSADHCPTHCCLHSRLGALSSGSVGQLFLQAGHNYQSRLLALNNKVWGPAWFPFEGHSFSRHVSGRQCWMCGPVSGFFTRRSRRWAINGGMLETAIHLLVTTVHLFRDYLQPYCYGVSLGSDSQFLTGCWVFND